MQNVGEIVQTSYPRNPRNKERKTILDPRNPRKTQSQTEFIAEKLVQKFKSPSHRNFFLKAAWRLSEERIDTILEYADKCPGDKLGYFITSVKREAAYNG